ncbi:TetR/AcrR family transcriptional regulator [Corynebacterium halotolerans]|uniref:Transcriptional regulator n=1 Tax=Corynebacterium halotolerans YIM 70093 = DSM 44683 TaxID=1121362 RepID=M1P350_9CORY|nr:TetR/AcrR family transcriptional regulator [Corynebacterium halotolerans]AGF71111.1 transcriptional regulator [Corynebacterium halotolerans YIM 70093 = DSM 44683]
MNLREQKAAETRRRFIDVAFELFSEQGYGATSMNQIAKHAGGSRANLYLHFRNKPDLVLAKMREIEPGIIGPFRGLFESAPHDAASVRAWLERMRDLWLETKVEFAAMEQAMSEDGEVAAEWLDMIRRMSHTMPGLAENRQRRQDFVCLLMSLDRNYYFLYVRGHRENEDFVLEALTRQWLTLFP